MWSFEPFFVICHDEPYKIFCSRLVMRQAAVPEIVRISMIDFFKLMTCKIIIKHLLVFICQLAIKSAVKWERSRIFFFLLSKVVIGTSVVIPESVEFINISFGSFSIRMTVGSPSSSAVFTVSVVVTVVVAVVVTVVEDVAVVSGSIVAVVAASVVVTVS